MMETAANSQKKEFELVHVFIDYKDPQVESGRVFELV